MGLHLCKEWLLADNSRDTTQAEKKIHVAKAEETQNDNF